VADSFCVVFFVIGDARRQGLRNVEIKPGTEAARRSEVVHRDTDRRRLMTQSFLYDVTVYNEELLQEGGRSDHGYLVLDGSLRREVLQVKGDHVIRAARDRGGQHMPVFWVVLHLRDERFVVIDNRIVEELTHGGFPVAGFLRCLAKPTDQGARDFREDLVGPTGLVEGWWLRQSQQGVRDWHGNQDARIENRYRAFPHSPALFVAAAFRNRGVIIKAGFERVAGHLVESRPPAFGATLGIGQDIT
jgi:hypothetical protein